MRIRTHSLTLLPVLASLALAACNDPETDRAAVQSLGDLNVIDESNLNDIMLNFADPNEAANHFRRSLAKDPTRADLRRGYAISLMRARRSDEAVLAFEQLINEKQATPQDRLLYAEALIQNNAWDEAGKQLDQIPPTLENYNRYRLEAMMADYRQQWDRSDAFYENARGLTTQPAPVYNNWGISMLSRGETQKAEEKFRLAISFDRDLFNAKNNLVLARAKRGVYELPVIPMTEVEEAQLYHNMAVQALRNGKTDVGKGLLELAVETHPQYFEEAAQKLEALNRSVSR
ncbi:MAG: tetratricopeptide repeat protein [Pseudomonadota bacterium]